MTKAIVKTTGQFSLQNTDLQYIDVMIPTCVKSTAFVIERLGMGELKLLAAELPDFADDKVLQEIIAECEGDHEMAVANFVSIVADEAEKRAEKNAGDAEVKRQEQEKAEAERLAKEKADKEAEEKAAKDSADAAAKEEADKKAKFEAEELAKLEAEEKAEKEAKAKAEADEKAKNKNQK